MAATKTKTPPKSGISHQKDHGLQGSVNKFEVFYLKNSKVINMVAIAIIVLIGAWFAYKNLYIKPQEKKAVAMVFKAQQYWAVSASFDGRLVSLLPAASALVILVAGIVMTIHAVPHVT